ncbi:auxin-responsive protein SAUR50 [Benincasa hispida]|uniref:auxin-responsive protein SAUR50 n=1 Tax=Benincasa hispida TaxID=102211 RepID=UPI001900FC05|nr:auxin-responsive protein SAUR50 [Benincasa hispida]
MDFSTEKVKNKGLILKTWERCKSMGRRGRNSPSSAGIKRLLTRKTKSLPHLKVFSGGEDDDEKERRRSFGGKGRVAPEGCFTVYVGAERQRFVIRTECANHPLFRSLLEEAEEEYGYNCQAPLSLPCDVESFYNVLMEMDDDGGADLRRGCGYPTPKRFGSYHLLSPRSSSLVVK